MHIYKMLFFTNKITLIWISLREAYIKILPDSLGKKKCLCRFGVFHDDEYFLKWKFFFF